jgi:large subunit ribosomal protein L21
MYNAIIKTGGKQYRVAKDAVIQVELLDAQVGDKVEFPALFANDGSDTLIGQPHIPNFLVHAEVLGEVKGEKGYGLKYKRSHNECRKWGFRQKYTEIKITSIGKHKGKEG